MDNTAPVAETTESGEEKMARVVRSVVQVDRLRDQVYELIRDDLKTGAIQPGQRLLEVELAEKYKVSRTPVREALFQLSRDGLLLGNERGYTAPTYNRRDALDRLEVKRLIDPRLAEHVAAEVDQQHVKTLKKHLEQQRAAHATGKVNAFNKANHAFRVHFRDVCKNTLLVRCVTLVDDQFEIARNRIHELAENREITIKLDEQLMDALTARDGKAAKQITIDFLAFLQRYYETHSVGD
jgi:DNA-binding GntR family transcriptional regulator